MADVVSNISLTSPAGINPYTVQLAEIERQRKLAQALQEQGMTSLGQTEMVGGWAIPRSPLEGMGKLAQALSGAYGQKTAAEREQALAQKYQSDQASTLSRALQAGMGTPAVPGQAPATPMDDEGNVMPGAAGSPAVPGDMARMGQILMEHPALQAAGQQQLMNSMAMQQLKAALHGGQGAAGQPSGAGGVGGYSGAPIELLGAGDMGKTVFQAINEQNKPVNVRPGGAAINPATGKVIFNQPQVGPGVNLQYGANGPTASPIPGAADAMAAQAKSVAGGTAEGTMPFGMQLMDVPVYLPGGDQISVKMNATQAHQYQTTGQLPPEIAASIPGLKQPAPQPVPQPAAQPRQPQIGNYPGDAPSAAAQAAGPSVRFNAPDNATAEGMARVLAAKGQPFSVSSLTGDPALAGSPVVGRTQSQGEAITQERQRAGGKATDETFAKDYTAFMQGGAQDAAKQLAQLRDVMQQLDAPKANLTGPVLGRVPDVVKSFTNPNAIAMRERVEEVVQRSLRAILGAQFTENEGVRLIARAYNQSQPESENAIRVGRLFTQLNQAFQQKQDAARYFEKNGTLQGWQGKLPSISDFDPTGGAVSGTSGGNPAVEAALRKYGG